MFLEGQRKEENGDRGWRVWRGFREEEAALFLPCLLFRHVVSWHKMVGPGGGNGQSNMQEAWVTLTSWKPMIYTPFKGHDPWLTPPLGRALPQPMPWNHWVLKSWSERFGNSTHFLYLEKSILILLVFRSIFGHLPWPCPEIQWVMYLRNSSRHSMGGGLLEFVVLTQQILL